MSAVEFGVSRACGPLLRSRFPGGLPVEWVLNAPDRARREAQPTGTATFLQNEHVMTASAMRHRGEEHRSIVGAISRFDETLDELSMAQAVTAFVRRHDELRSHYVILDDGSVERRVTPARFVEFACARSADAAPIDASAAGEYLAEQISMTTAHDVTQAMRFGALTDDDGFTFYLGADHVHGDGYSLWLAMTEIAALYRSHTTGIPVVLPDSSSYGDYIAKEAAVSAQLSPDDARVSMWREAMALTGGVPEPAMDLGLTGGVPQQAVRCRRDLLGATDADVLDDFAAAQGVSVTGCLYAALASAQYALSGDTTFATTTAVATRDDAHVNTQGWLCNFAPVYFTIDPEAELVDLAHTATCAVRRAMRASGAPIGAVLMALARTGDLPERTSSPQMVTYIDHRRLPGIDDPAVATTVGFPGIGKTKNANLWLSRMVDGIVVESQIPDNPVARENMTRYLDQVSEQLSSLVQRSDTPVRESIRVGS